MSDWQIPEKDEIEVAMVQYETDTSTDAKRFSIHLCNRLMESPVFHEIVRRVRLSRLETCVAIQAGIEIGYRLRALQQEQPKR